MIDQLDLDKTMHRAKVQLVEKKRNVYLLVGVFFALLYFVAFTSGLIYGASSNSITSSLIFILLLIFCLVISAYARVSYLSRQRNELVKGIVEKTFTKSISSDAILYNSYGFLVFVVANLYIGALFICLAVPYNALISRSEIITIASPIWVIACVIIKRTINRTSHPEGLFYWTLTYEILIYLAYMCVFSLWLPSVAQLPLIADSEIVRNNNIDPFTFILILFSLVFICANLFGYRHYRAAMRLLGIADYTKALASIHKMIKAYPYSVAGLGMKGVILIFCNQLEKAEAVLQRALAVPIYSAIATPTIMTNLGYAILRQKRYEEALRIFSVAIEADATQYAAYLGLVEIYLAQGLAINRCTALLKIATVAIQPRKKADRQNWAEILIDRAWIFTLMKQHSNADQLIKQALAETNQKFKPSLAILNYRIGQIMVMRGDKAKAVNYFQQSHEIDPEGVYAQSSLDAVVAFQRLADTPPAIPPPIT